MCGFIGVTSFKGGVPESLNAELGLLRHRGPDASKSFREPKGRTVFGFNRLSIIDLETGDQPLFNESRSIALVCNGEIYNYKELRRELEQRGHRFRTHGDMETIAHLYEDDPDGFLGRLEGMFALALWDAERGRLVLARDPLGIKPLYYRWEKLGGDARLVYASEMKPLLQLHGGSGEVDPEGLSQYLSYGYTLAPNTLFRDIKKLEPGSALFVEDGRAVERAYWDCAAPELTTLSGAALEEQVLAAFDRAIELHLRSDVPVAAFLSGGIDSGLIVARAARLNRDLRTYTLRFQGRHHDESALAAEVAKQYGTQHRLFTVDQSELLSALPRMLWYCDEPLSDSGLIPNYVINRLAAEDGVKVVLNGAGGDELFAGYPYFFPNRVEKRLLRVPGITGLASSIVSPFNPEVSRKLERALALRSDPAQHYLGHVAVWPEFELERLLAGRPLKEQRRLGYLRRFQGDALNARLYSDLKTYLTDDLMLLLDRTSMAHSIEGRVPFLHHPFVELVMGVPGEVKAPGSERKGLLRSIARAHLPASLFEQPKMGFNSPIRDWMQGRLGDLAVRVLSSERSLSRPWWHREALLPFLQSPQARGRGYHRLYTLLVLELYWRIHVETPSATPIHSTLEELSRD